MVGNLSPLPTTARCDELFGASPRCPTPEPYDPAPGLRRRASLVEERDTNQSHLRMSYRPESTSTDAPSARRSTIYATLLGGSMGSRLFDEIREQRGLAYAVSALDHAFSDVPDPPALAPAWTRRSASRPTSA